MNFDGSWDSTAFDNVFGVVTRCETLPGKDQSGRVARD